MKENRLRQKQLWRELTIISKTQNNPIGFFDSGVGGLTVLSEFKKVLPAEDCIFFGDTQNMPYGEKSKEQLLEFSDKAFKFFEKCEVKAVVMACNTTSAVVYEELKDNYNFILYPLIQSVSKIFAQSAIKRLGVFATPATVNAHAYANNIKKYNNNIEVIEIYCPEWVKLVENNLINTDEAEQHIKKYMDKMLDYSPEKIILGCTHYPYLINILSKYYEKDNFINPAKTYADFIKKDLYNKGLLKETSKNGYDKFFVSGNSEDFINSSKMFYNILKCENLQSYIKKHFN